jgi:hypothetical protein
MADPRLDAVVAALVALGAPSEAGFLVGTPLADADAVRWRQEVFRDAEVKATADAWRAFATTMDGVRAHLDRAASIRHPHERDRWRLAAMDACRAGIEALLAALEAGGPDEARSRGVVAFRDWRRGYVASNAC